MKEIILIAGLLLLTFDFAISQENKSTSINDDEFFSISLNDIDPRQYITVNEVRNLEKTLIWKFNPISEESHQRRKIIDASSTIEIDFDKLGISANEDFKGNITIEGKIVSGEGGEDPVEVYPYTKIGEEKTRIGITTRPPNEIATIFVNLILESLRTKVRYKSGISTDNSYAVVLVELQGFLNKLENLPPDVFFPTRSERDNRKAHPLYSHISLIIDRYPIEDYYPVIFRRLQNEDEIKNSELLSELQKVRDYIANRVDIVDSQASFKQELENFRNSLEIIVEYIRYFKSSGEKAEDAFLSIIKLDHIALDKIETNLSSTISEITDYLNSSSDSSITSQQIELKISNALRNIDKLSEIKSSDTALKYLDRFVLPNEPISILDDKIVSKERIISDLAIRASEVIYRELDYATINLLKERAQEGDILYLYVVLEENKRRVNGDNKNTSDKILPIGSYEIRKTEWEVKIADSFLLVNRINEPNSSEDSSISPSNFKGAPGISLLLTYRRDGAKTENQFVNFLEPSFGVNVSYVDFSTADDLEVGAGLVLGLFNNKIFVTGGINLNSTGKDEIRPFYWGLGFSFANIVGKLVKKE